MTVESDERAELDRLRRTVDDLRDERRRVEELLESVPVQGEVRDLLLVVAEAARQSRLWKDWHNEAERRNAEVEELRRALAQANAAHEAKVSALHRGADEWRKLAEERGERIVALQDQITRLSRGRVPPRDANA